MRIVFLDLDTLHPADLNLSALHALSEGWREHGRTTPEQTKERLKGAHIAISNKVYIGAAEMAAATDLKLICIAATGTNNVDLLAAEKHGIAVRNVTDYSTPAVLQHTFALILTLMGRLDQQRQVAHSGTWSRSTMFCVLDHPFNELAGKTLGIIGHGNIGKSVARVAEAFGMRVAIAQHPSRPAKEQQARIPLPELLAISDIVSLHCPLTPQTQNLIGHKELQRMKPNALLINTARGGLVDEAALLAALDQGIIAGAGLDVLAIEPPAPPPEILRVVRDNLVITPHIAWASKEARQRLVDGVVQNIKSFLKTQ